MSVYLFDVDGTLTMPIKKIDNNVVKMLESIKKYGNILAAVSGSDHEKMKNQLDKAYGLFDYICSENGLVVYEKGILVRNESIIDFIGNKNYSDLINIILKELSKINIPIKRGNFIELRNAALNISPIGRKCDYYERTQFYDYDNQHKIRRTLLNKLLPILDNYELTGSIGGMISIDIYPKGWDKTQCLYLFKGKNIYFFGDKTEPGGNDHTIFTDNRVNGFTVKNPEDTIRIVKDLL